MRQDMAPIANNQKKRVTDFIKNVEDVLGKNHHYWAWPCNPPGGLENCDGLYWSISEFH